MPSGLFNPVTSEAFTVAPEVVYSPIVFEPKFATNRSEPSIAMPSGALNPSANVISEAFTVAPPVVNSLIVLPPKNETNMSEPETAMPNASTNESGTRGRARCSPYRQRSCICLSCPRQ